MHNPGNGLSAYWLQGTIDERVDKYNTAIKSAFTKNRFRVKNLSIINYWGDQGPLPETLTVNLSRNTAWSLGTEVELQTSEKDDEFNDSTQSRVFKIGKRINYHRIHKEKDASTVSKGEDDRETASEKREISQNDSDKAPLGPSSEGDEIPDVRKARYS